MPVQRSVFRIDDIGPCPALVCYDINPYKSGPACRTNSNPAVQSSLRLTALFSASEAIKRMSPNLGVAAFLLAMSLPQLQSMLQCTAGSQLSSIEDNQHRR
jgi:hypothetical protein